MTSIHHHHHLIAVLMMATTTLLMTDAQPLASSKQYHHRDASLQDPSSRTKVLYDQRQEGEWNVRADLKNFVILLIPTSSQPQQTAGSLTPPTGGLLDFFAKALPKAGMMKRPPHHHHQHVNRIANDDVAATSAHFIESKTAPYHVDISQTKDHLAKLRPDAVTADLIDVVRDEGTVIANSPSLAILKKDDTERLSRAFVLTVPMDEEFVLTATEDERKVVKKDAKKKQHQVAATNKNSLKLLGAENEQCGPEFVRDSNGNCVIYQV